MFFVIFRSRHFEKCIEGFKFGEIFIVITIISRKDPKITRGGFYHVYGSTKWFKIVNNVTREICVAPINGHDWQPFKILRPLL